MEDKLRIKTASGEEKEYDVLYSFVSQNTGKTYVVYTDFTKDNDTMPIYGSIYEDGKLSNIETEPEKKIVESFVNTINETGKIKYQLSDEN